MLVYCSREVALWPPPVSRGGKLNLQVHGSRSWPQDVALDFDSFCLWLWCDLTTSIYNIFNAYIIYSVGPQPSSPTHHPTPQPHSHNGQSGVHQLKSHRQPNKTLILLVFLYLKCVRRSSIDTPPWEFCLNPYFHGTDEKTTKCIHENDRLRIFKNINDLWGKNVNFT